MTEIQSLQFLLSCFRQLASEPFRVRTGCLRCSNCSFLRNATISLRLIILRLAHRESKSRGYQGVVVTSEKELIKFSPTSKFRRLLASYHSALASHRSVERSR